MQNVWEQMRNLVESKASLPMLLAFGCLLAALGMAIAARILGKREQGARQGGRPKRAVATAGGEYWQRMYGLLQRFQLSKHFLMAIRNRLEMSSEFDERGLRKQSTSIFMTTFVLLAGVMIVFSMIARDVFLIGLFCVLLCFLTGAVVDISVAQVGTRLMRQQLRFHEHLRHRYGEEQSVDGAVEEACQSTLEDGGHLMYAQGEILLDMLGATDTERAFERYRETAPNKYLKLLAGMCCITREYGDAQVSNGSVFLRSLGYLSAEIRSALFLRDRLLYALKSLNVLTLLPLFFLRPIRNWAGESFAPLARFYESGAGTVMEVVMVGLTLLCYLAIRHLQHFDVGQPEQGTQMHREEKLYRRWLHPLVDRTLPSGYSAKYVSLEGLLKKAVSPLRPHELQVRQYLSAAAGCLTMLLLCLVLILQAQHQVLYRSSVPEGFLGGKLSEKDKAALEAELALDRFFLEGLPRNAEAEEVRQVVHASGAVATEEVEIVVQRVLNKQEALRRNQFPWWVLLLCFAAWQGGWWFPMAFLRFQAAIRKMDLEDEVSRFQTIILMLMHMPRVNVEELLEWMEMFSLHFRAPLQTCLSDYNAGAVEALEALKNEVAFEPMSVLVGDLMLAASDLSIPDAFGELESEREYGMENRKEQNARVVERKRHLGNMVGFLPLYALIVLYLMIPMVVSSMTEMNRFYEQMSSF